MIKRQINHHMHLMWFLYKVHDKNEVYPMTRSSLVMTNKTYTSMKNDEIILMKGKGNQSKMSSIT